MDDVALVSRMLTEHGLEEYAELVLPTMCSCAYLVVADGLAGSGRSRFGGDPDLPPDASWPVGDAQEPLAFALQVDLAQVPEAARGPLPPAGLLSLFVGADEPATDVTTQIVLIPDGAVLVRTPAPTGVVETFMAHARTCAVEVVAAPDLPRWATDDHERITSQEMTEDQVEDFDDVILALEPPGREVLGRLMGHAAGVGHDPRKDAHVVRDVDPALLYDWSARAKMDLAPARHWQHLVTIESSEAVDLTIWDAGYLQVLAHADDLAALRFDRTYTSVESS